MKKRSLTLGGVMLVAFLTLAACEDTLDNLQNYDQRAEAYCQRSDAAYLARSAIDAPVISEEAVEQDAKVRIVYGCGPFPQD